MTLLGRTVVTISCVVFLGLGASPSSAGEPRIFVSGSVTQTIAEYESNNYWGEIPRDERLTVAPYLTVAVIDIWDKEAAALPVEVKKELFYRTLLPLVLYSNELILNDRDRLSKISQDSTQLDHDWLETLAYDYRLLDRDAGEVLPEGDELQTLIEALLTRVDAIPPSLALGQAAYESGYGTSRFAREGNALFGQWVYGGAGMAPKQKRASKGDYGIAAYDWPLDSVRSYMLNLNSHPSYTDLRKKRSAARASDQIATGAELADTLTKYSEKGAAYVKTLKGIMRANDLDIADKAVLRDDPVIAIVDVESEDEVASMEAEIDKLRAAGELAEILAEMGVALD